MIDVAVVGAGPAGAWTAYLLARRGARVVVFDPSHPREKPCGGGVTGRAIELVTEAIGQPAWPFTTITSARFVARNDDGAVVPIERGALTVASRSAFDAALLDSALAAGATLCKERVRSVSEDRDGVSIGTSAGLHRAGLVVGADGPTSLVRRSFSRPFGRAQLSIATGYFVHGATSSEIVIELANDPPGYFWSFPRPDHLAVGVCAQADAAVRADSLRQRTAAWITDTRLGHAGARLVPYSWPIPSLPARDLEALAPAGARWLLVGDAAGLVDPITREGIFFAIASAAWAADAIGSARATSAYAARVLDEAVPELARAARLKTGFFNPAFTRLLIAALRRSANIRAVMADLIAGRQSYRTLKWRLLSTLELGVAWRAITGRSSRPAP